MSDTVKAKIASLLNVTAQNGATEAEALSAMEIAAKLMKKYSVTLEDLTTNSQAASDFVRKSAQGDRQYIHPVDKYVSMAIAEYTDTRVWNSKQYRKSNVNFFGYSVDVELALYIRSVCMSAMDYEWNRYKRSIPTHIHASRHRASFLMGMGQRLSERLRKMKQQMTQETTNANTLVVAKTNAVSNEFEKIVAKLTPAKSTRIRLSHSAYDHGQSAADQVRLNRPVENKPSSSVKLLN